MKAVMIREVSVLTTANSTMQSNFHIHCCFLLPKMDKKNLFHDNVMDTILTILFIYDVANRKIGLCDDFSYMAQGDLLAPVRMVLKLSVVWKAPVVILSLFYKPEFKCVLFLEVISSSPLKDERVVLWAVFISF